MTRKIKITVDTGYSGASHEDIEELPHDWDTYTGGEKEDYLNDMAREYLNNCCDAYARVVDDE